MCINSIIIVLLVHDKIPINSLETGNYCYNINTVMCSRFTIYYTNIGETLLFPDKNIRANTKNLHQYFNITSASGFVENLEEMFLRCHTHMVQVKIFDYTKVYILNVINVFRGGGGEPPLKMSLCDCFYILKEDLLKINKT